MILLVTHNKQVYHKSFWMFVTSNLFDWLIFLLDNAQIILIERVVHRQLYQAKVVQSTVLTILIP